jgi:hypothetical protein
MRHTRKNFKPKAIVPFQAELAREFHRSSAHIWRLIVGERQSPLREKILARQLELMHAAAMAPVTTEAASAIDSDRSKLVRSAIRAELKRISPFAKKEGVLT